MQLVQLAKQELVDWAKRYDDRAKKRANRYDARINKPSKKTKKVEGNVKSNNPKNKIMSSWLNKGSKKTKKVEGVSWCEDNKKWKAEIFMDKAYGLGYYDSYTSACMAVNRAIDRGKKKK